MAYTITVTAESFRCIDRTSPFEVRHLGQISVTHTIDKHVRAPNNHCVVQQKNSGELIVLRFSPFDPKSINPDHKHLVRKLAPDLPKFFSSVDEATDIHLTHLQKLGELGIKPWFKEVKAGVYSDDKDTSGIYVLQDILPPETKLLSPEHQIVDKIYDIVYDYYLWAQNSNQPAFLSDIEAANQYSILPDGQVVLHDIEPTYIAIDRMVN